MRTLVSMVAVAAIAFVGCQNDFSRARGGGAGGDDLVLRAHFIGSQQLLKDKNAPKLAEVWNLKSSADLRNDALNKFSRLPAAWMGSALPKGTGDQANAFRSLLEDALAHESFVEWHVSAFTLASKVPETRAKAWDTNLRSVAANWKLGSPSAFNANGNSGWEIAKGGAPGLRFVRAGEWVAVTVGQGAANAEAAALSKLKQFAKGDGAWLAGDVNLAQWKERAPLLENFNNLPLAHFSFSNRSDSVRTFVQFDFPKPHGWKSEPWQIPTNFIRDPLVDFTVARGISGVLEALPSFRNLGVRPVPNQMCGWGNHDVPYQFNFAFATRDVTNQLKRMQPKVSGELKRLFGTNLEGGLIVATNLPTLVWRGLPAFPSVGPMNDGENQFLFAQLAPLPRLRDRPPRELFAQFVGQDNLVLYDWEASQHRFANVRQLYQLGEIATKHVIAPTNALDISWQLDIAPHLGESATELRATSPTQMTLGRKSTIGFTAFELATLSRWTQSANFPAFGVYTPQPARRLPQKAGAKPGQ